MTNTRKDTTLDVEEKEIHTILHDIYDMAGAMYEIGCWGKMERETKVSRLLTDDIKEKDICNLGAQLTAVLNKINIDFTTALSELRIQHEKEIAAVKEAAIQYVGVTFADDEAVAELRKAMDSTRKEQVI